MLLRVLRKLQLLIWRGRFQRELGEEMAFHREQVEAEFRAGGMSPEQARRLARRQFGNDLQLQEQTQDVVAFRLEGMLQDLRFAVRQLRKNPAFAGTAVLVLALGMAASVAIFAFVDAALLQPLPYHNPSRLVVAYETTTSCRDCSFSYPDYLDFKKTNTSFSSFEAWDASVYLWRGPEGVQAVRSAHVSGGFFRSLGVTAMLGRGFTDSDDMPAAPRTVVLTFGTWQSRFGGRPDILGQSLILDNLPYSVIGVLPREFHFAMRAAEFFTTIHDLNHCQQSRGCQVLEGFGRLRDGVSLDAAMAEMKTIAARLEKEYPESNKGRSARLVPLRDAIVGDIRPTLLVLSSGAGLLLLIAYVNVASLLLVRAESRKRETVLRGVLGASLGRLIRQFVTEGVLLVTVAAAFAIPAASAAIPWLFSLIPERRLRGMPYFRDAGLHPHVLLFAAVISLLAVVVFSVTPVLRLSLSSLRADLAEGGRGSAGTLWKRFGSNLVAAELAIAMVLLASAGLLGKSLYRMFHVDLNFNPANLATLEVDVQGAGYEKSDQLRMLSQRLLEHISAMPGVVSVAHTSDLPITCNCSSTEFRVLGHPWYGEHDKVLQRQTSANYFKALQARLIAGRFYTEADDSSKPRVAVVNRALAKLYFPGEDPVGRTIGDAELSPKSLAQVIGVVDDVREGDLVEPLVPALYYSFNQETEGTLFLVVRTEQDTALMRPSLVRAIHQVDPNLGVRNEFVMADRINDSPAAFLNRSSAWLVGGFAASALLLGAIGLYGVVAYSVSQRTREIGVRMALGAQRGAVYRLILGQAGSVAAVGIVVGLGCAVPAAALLRGLLFGVQSWDAPTLIGVALALGICALVASYLPARRAASVDPVEALRAE
ncbi:MAG: ABC transporter permease [Bryobacteraceae bacterium]